MIVVLYIVFLTPLFGQSMEIAYDLDFPLSQEALDIEYGNSENRIELNGILLGVPVNIECCVSYVFKPFALYGTERAFISFAGEIYLPDGPHVPHQLAAYLGGGIEYCLPRLDFLPLRLAMDFGFGNLETSAMDEANHDYLLHGMMSAFRPKISLGWRMSDSFIASLAYVNKFVAFKGNAAEFVWLWQSVASLQFAVSLPVGKGGDK